MDDMIQIMQVMSIIEYVHLNMFLCWDKDQYLGLLRSSLFSLYPEVAATSCACQDVWMRSILDQLGESHGKCKVILRDKSSTIKMSKNPVMRGRYKHIDVRYHFLRDLTKEGIVELAHFCTQDQLADVVTNP